MLGFNWVDVIIVILLVLAVAEGIRIGLLTQLFLAAGFFGTLFAAGWLFPHILPIHDSSIRMIVNASLVLVAAAYVGIRCFDLGQKIHWSFRLGKLTNNRNYKMAETVLGSLPGIAAGLILVWLLGVAIGRLPFAGLSNSANDSRIVQQLTRALPPVPAVFAQFDRQVNPNSQPYVFVQPKPQADFNYSALDAQLAASKSALSLARITSFGCGGIVSGTGFAVGSDLIATNAHVIAGVKRPIVKYNGSSYEAVPVMFDPVLDLAIIRVQALKIPPLALASGNVALNTTVAVLGYPGGNYRAVPGLVRDTRAVSATNIYDQGAFGRGVYEVQTSVDYGSSGGPIVLKNGQVAGIMFSKSIEFPNHAYALTSSHIASALHKVETSHQRVGTGACMVQ